VLGQTPGGRLQWAVRSRSVFHFHDDRRDVVGLRGGACEADRRLADAVSDVACGAVAVRARVGDQPVHAELVVAVRDALREAAGDEQHQLAGFES
jgi:hypothetical protein